ncbi:MAG: ATP-binding cassette domain-containing protein [Asgard group archaeon]|nr:ATP-binding cassette domain-containing protein [Asgard group archaeon]
MVANFIVISSWNNIIFDRVVYCFSPSNISLQTRKAGVKMMIECTDVIKIYTDPETKTRIAALRGIDLYVRRGELVSIIGPSGSGKSTLVRLLAGIESISSGIVRVNGHDLGKMTLDELIDYRLKTVGIVHQFPERTLFLSGTVMDNLNFASSLYSQDLKENKAYNKELLSRLGIDYLEKRRVKNLSGGEMIRTAVACMLAKRVPFLLCDEPTGQLDSENTEKVKSILKEIAHEFNATVLVVTHDLRFLKGVDRTCEIHSGRVSSLYAIDESLRVTKDQFPMKFTAQIDSSQSVRIPNEVYNVLQVRDNLDFIVSEDSKVALTHPNGIPPKRMDVHEKKKQKLLEIKALPSDYFASKNLDVKLRNVSKIYGKRDVQVHALTDISLQFHSGELVFIVGPSGSGKTTLMKLITGMEPVTTGSISAFNRNISELNDLERAKYRREDIGIVSQQGDLHPYITVKENLFLKELFSGKSIAIQKYPEDSLSNIFNMFQIAHRKESYPLEISGGELQRASLAIAQFTSPKVLVLDEPTANMDSELADAVIDQLYQLHEQLKTTILITTHDISLVKDGTRVVELIDGKINRDGLAYPIEAELD